MTPQEEELLEACRRMESGIRSVYDCTIVGHALRIVLKRRERRRKARHKSKDLPGQTYLPDLTNLGQTP